MSQLMKPKNAATVLHISDHNEIQKFDSKDTIIVTDLNCPDSRRFLQQADDSQLFGKPYRWLIIAKMNEFRDIPTELINMKILIDSEVIVPAKTGEVFNLNLVYRIDHTSKFRTEEFGIWTADEGLKKSANLTKTTMVIRRKDLNGKSIAASDLKVDNMAKATHCNILPLYDFMNATKALFFTDTWGNRVIHKSRTSRFNTVHNTADTNKAEVCIPRASPLFPKQLVPTALQSCCLDMYWRTGSLGRVVTFLMFLIFLFLYTSYSANIVALLQSSSNQIRTLTDLLNSKLELGVEDEKYNRHYFPAATEPVRKSIYETKIEKVGYKPNFMSLEEGVRRLQNPFCTMRGGSFASVNMVDFHPVLLWMLYGMSLSVFLLVVEILLYRRQGKMEKA
ncbi:putative chemosensory ionotropic receptor IR75q.1 [Operophtera brumata]|uniref:Putative chemosensory ionotropic receptor IR75q.1 n=1 Tax=Operophtera brumata TaxID=104452 RepID=A0A0L7KQ36_OPEBR|nr:putative chemosensory ionotropic receptor IR75q.1 [Operophtera brumata]